MKDIEAIGEHLPGARLRLADFFAALAGAFDRGSWSFEDVDLAVLTVPTLLSKAEADAAMRVVLEDYGHCDDAGGGRGEGLTRDSAGCVPGS